MFPNFRIEDLQLTQQKDEHSCAIINHYNIECFAQGVMPAANVDAEAIRENMLEYIQNFPDVLLSVMGLGEKGAQATRYFETPIYRIPFTPV